jgi:hypothetical protein
LSLPADIKKEKEKEKEKLKETLYKQTADLRGKEGQTSR